MSLRASESQPADTADPPRSIGPLERHLRARRQGGNKLLVAYMMAGLPGWVTLLHALTDAGVDAIEVGIPFSDPMIDGPVIQQAALEALRQGTTPHGVLDALRREEIGVPLVVMTYYNLFARAGEHRMAGMLADAGVAGTILPDLPLEEAVSWGSEAQAAGIDNVLLIAPSTPEDRARAICAQTRGFLYAVGLMGVTGERAVLGASAGRVATMARRLTDVPVCVGVGISTAAQAAEACGDADGVVVGSALVRRVLDGEGLDAIGQFIGELRSGIDGS